MKHLIIYAHPSSESLNATIKDYLVNILKDKHEVKIRDLNQLNFNPVLSERDLNDQRRGVVADDVKTEHQLIEWAEYLTFIYPIWWTGMPAIMKGYIDRVFSYGFAYRYVKGKQQGLLNHKKIVIINTQGKSAEEYRESGMHHALTLTSDFGIFNYCGMKIMTHFYFDRADRITSTQINDLCSTIDDIYQR
ncbi:NAD(P)H-dependent oxidoreductase [Pseudoalteromonas mariniglutinosa]|uniref:NAD(P)H-dependent oxidoreductase n=1 Tax=Pseudoalteromonas mariniglutinosa TaxID=206042 RepID=UPI00384EF3D1